MALVESNMLPLGTLAPDFTLPDTVSGKTFTLEDFRSNTATVVMFLSNHCPYVKFVNPEIAHLAVQYQAQGIKFCAIACNDITRYPDDAPEFMKETAEKEGYTFPYLYDESQTVARAYDAACTPDFYIFNKDLKLVYRGQLDSARPSNGKVPNGENIRAALDNLITGLAVNPMQRPSAGCSIKWKQ